MTKSPIRIPRWLGVVLLSCALLGGAGAAERLIGISVLTMNNPFFKDIVEAARAEAQKRGYQVVAVSGDLDVAKQQNQVKDFIVRKVAAIILCPCDSKAIGPAIREANAAGIPVFTADIACLDPAAKVVAHVATDNRLGGRMAADAMVEALNGKGRIAILDHPEVESGMMRTRGFEERLTELRKERPELAIEVVAKLPGNGDKAKSFQATQDLIQAHPQLDGIFAVNDPSALGAAAALEAAGKKGVKLVGFDGQPEGLKAIASGIIYADPVQFPDRIGAETVRALVATMDGEEVKAQILIPTVLYRQADAAKALAAPAR
jgi:ribose transport system substrate-binding protein